MDPTQSDHELEVTKAHDSIFRVSCSCGWSSFGFNRYAAREIGLSHKTAAARRCADA